MSRDGHEDVVRVSEFEVKPLSVSTCDGPSWVVLQCGPVPDADEVQRFRETAGHPGHGVIYQRSRRAPHGTLMLYSTILDSQRQYVWLGEGELHVWLERDSCFAQRTLDGEGCRGWCEGDIGWYWNGLLPNV